MFRSTASFFFACTGLTLICMVGYGLTSWVGDSYLPSVNWILVGTFENIGFLAFLLAILSLVFLPFAGVISLITPAVVADKK